MSLLSVEKHHTFHAQEREIFSKLVLKFSRSPAESLLVMATWLWFEDFGFGNIFAVIMVSSSDSLIMDLAKEAVVCLKCLESSKPPNGDHKIPLTTRFMKKDITLNLIYQHRYTGITGIKNFLTTVCSKIFSDIIQQVLPSSSSSSSDSNLCQPLKIPGFPHPIFGDINVMPSIAGRDNLQSNYPTGIWSWNAYCTASVEDRTLFLTFSRGFPVSVIEVKQLFTYLFGEDCVEEVYMQGNDGNSSKRNTNGNGKQQSLYARLVCDSVLTLDRILDGQVKRKYRVNGKHIWARKFESRDSHKE